METIILGFMIFSFIVVIAIDYNIKNAAGSRPEANKQ